MSSASLRTCGELMVCLAVGADRAWGGSDSARAIAMSATRLADCVLLPLGPLPDMVTHRNSAGASSLARGAGHFLAPSHRAGRRPPRCAATASGSLALSGERADAFHEG